MSEDYRLKIEMVPRTSWYVNLRKMLPRAEWDRLRKRVYAQYGHRCAICRGQGRLSCHEIWQYDDTSHIQRLAGFAALCSPCHHIKHLGFATGLAEAGRLDFERLIRHFMRVNGCSREAFEAQQELAFRQWEERSQVAWQIEIGDYHSLVEGIE